MIDPQHIVYESAFTLRAMRSSKVPDKELYERNNVWTMVRFLQEKSFTTRTIASTLDDIDANFVLKFGDLTAEGMSFFGKVQEIWLDIPFGDLAQARDASRFERAYARVLKKKAGTADTPAGSDLSVKAVAASGKTPKPPKLPPPDEDDDFAKYDDASWHTEGDFPSDLDADAARTHIGMFIAWALTADLLGEMLADDFCDDLEQLRARAITPGTFARMIDGRVTEEELSPDGGAFAKVYYTSKAKGYLSDYTKTLAAGLTSTYHVPDTWETFDALKPVIDKRFAAWQAKA